VALAHVSREADVDNRIKAAELAFFSPEAPDTIILREVKP
jgi:hypothetical protein